MSLFRSFSRHGERQPSISSPATAPHSAAAAAPQQASNAASSAAAAAPPKAVPVKPVTSVDNDHPPRPDGSDKYYGMENFGNTCYCNSVVQALFYTKPFRDAVLSYPRNNVSPPPPPRQDSTEATTSNEATPTGSFVETSSIAPLTTATNAAAPTSPNPPSPSTPKTDLAKTKSNSGFSFGRGKLNRTNSDTGGTPTSPSSQLMKSPMFPNGAYSMGPPSFASMTGQPSNPYAPGPYSLNGAIASTSIIAQNAQKDPNAPAPLPGLPVDYSRHDEYGMKESLFTCLKDLFERIVGEHTKSGIIAPTKLVEVLKRENELFQGNTHQDAHEFLNYLLNDVVESVDRYEKSISSSSENNSRWVHELFEGILTSETKCLTCENLTTRDEVFLDLSIDIEQNSSVSACLRQFSASEMLCERNKFHCDICGGLQEAEKRMKIKKTPKILALHLKRFKYTEDMQRNLKLFHRVVYPPTLRLFNTTDDADDPDRLYELYAVVVHIGGGPYHGHYVTIVKNDETGKWMLIDDEAVEAVDDGFVGRFYGDRPGMASAYVLFYQQVEQKPIEPVEATAIPNGKHAPNGVATNEKRPVNGHTPQPDQLVRVPSSPASRVPSTRISSLATVEEKASPQVPQQATPPKSPTPTAQLTAPQTPATPATAATSATVTPSKSSTLERTPTKKELKDAAKREKEEKKREKEEAKQREKEGKKLGRGLGTIKRWGKDKDKS